MHNYLNPDHRTLYAPDQLPYGLGPRVPMLVISPWSRGGYVCSEVFDHTSVIRFLEARFGVHEQNITPWRRAVCGDLTAAFDFTSYSARTVILPSTDGYRDRVHRESKLPPPTVPERPSDPVLAQEPGLRPARALPYALELDLLGAPDGVHLRFDNRSRVGISCTAYWDASYGLPRRYTLGARHRLDDFVPLPPGQALAMTVHGPNGFVRKLRGEGICELELASTAQPDGSLRLHLRNVGERTLSVRVRDEAYGRGEWSLRIAPRETLRWDCRLESSHHWYDLSVDAHRHHWRLAGHAETGRESFTDPASAAVVLSFPEPAPTITGSGAVPNPSGRSG